MNRRLLRSIGILAVVLAAVLLAPAPVVGQAASSEAKTWTAPRTPAGRPDLQGLWTMATFTPLERPEHLAGKEFFSEEEAAELRQVFTAEGVDPLARSAINEKDEEKRRKRLRQSKESIHYDNAIWLATTRPKGLSSRRTSLIVDPLDGRIPPLTPEAQKREADRKAARSFDSHETRPLAERCLVWRHEGPPMLPPSYNDVLQIFQAPGYVVMLLEQVHEVRVVPLDGRPPLSQNIGQWNGDSRGHWDGDSLVVTTTNLDHRVSALQPWSIFHSRDGSGEDMALVERFTRVDEDTLEYEIQVSDPQMYQGPWTVAYPFRRTPELMFEYACHEGNLGMEGILSGGRAEDAAEAESR